MRRVLKSVAWDFSRWMLKSPSSTRGVPSSGSLTVTHPTPPGSHQLTWGTIHNYNVDFSRVGNSNCMRFNELLPVGDGRRSNFHSFEIRRPVPPPLPIVRGVWEKVKLVERAAGVAVSSGLIQSQLGP